MFIQHMQAQRAQALDAQPERTQENAYEILLENMLCGNIDKARGCLLYTSTLYEYGTLPFEIRGLHHGTPGYYGNERCGPGHAEKRFAATGRNRKNSTR